MTTPDNTALVLRQGDQQLAQQDTPPDFVGVPAPQWAAMSLELRMDAIQFFRQEQAETIDGIDIKFPRIKYPASGSKYWTFRDASGEESPLRELEMVVIFKHAARAYWAGDGEPQAGTPPMCKSDDAIRPVPGPGRQAPTCAACPHSQWGSHRNGVGQACKAVLNLFGLFQGDEVPTHVRLPPTGIRAFSDYAMLLRKEPKKYPGGLIGFTTKFALKEATNRAGIKYTGVEFSVGEGISYEEMVRSRALANQFSTKMRLLSEEAMVDEEEPVREGVTVIDATATRDDSDVPF